MRSLTPGRNLVLIGLMGAGKSTVGRLIAGRLERPFVDTDELVEQEAGQPIHEIFAAAGQRAFREHEAEAIRRVSALRGQVVAVGGGAVTDPRNVTWLRATGDLVLLDAPPGTLAERVSAAPDARVRPLLQGTDDVAGRLAQLRASRDQAYASAASHTVQTAGLAPEEIADRVLQWARHQPGLLTRDEREGMPA